VVITRRDGVRMEWTLIGAKPIEYAMRGGHDPKVSKAMA
jgi:hypothetical protein